LYVLVTFSIRIIRKGVATTHRCALADKPG